MTAAELLNRKADEYRALGEEHALSAGERFPYLIVELALRAVADALERADDRDREAA